MEVLARQVAQAHLGSSVEHHDDGSKDSVPDTCITYPDGRFGWLEAVRDTEGTYAAQQAKHLVETTERARTRRRSRGEEQDIAYATPLVDRPRGEVIIRPAVFSHSHSTNESSRWVRAFSARHGDVAGTMSADRGEEQHAFVRTTVDPGSEQACIIAQRGLSFRRPPEDPPLPVGVTHLWIAGAGRSHLGG